MLENWSWPNLLFTFFKRQIFEALYSINFHKVCIVLYTAPFISAISHSCVPYRCDQNSWGFTGCRIWCSSPKHHVHEFTILGWNHWVGYTQFVISPLKSTVGPPSSNGQVSSIWHSEKKALLSLHVCQNPAFSNDVQHELGNLMSV